MTQPNQPSEYSPGYVLPLPELRAYRNSAGLHVQAVQLTKANMRAVYEWADSKQFFEPAGPKPDDGLVVTGLTIFTADGRRKANFGDWVVRWAVNGTFDRYDALTFGQFFTEVQS
ncbi:hypothetical protein DKT68_15385 [Micromonospora acroterricola]|uniref:Uncharacterized protein n=1 Tax=Micromonospora acroterricola TaxID=2202421 RepID=A0A317D7K8_9ACTN|nr:hypothetical protein [Micromonospora acroterricola]PWR08595.1 hypothetical protein DKT68_15385 [Micromonospora acroterricola]